MIFYGKELISLGIILLIAAAVAGILFLSLHLLMSSKVRKALEKEYGSNDPGGR